METVKHTALPATETAGKEPKKKSGTGRDICQIALLAALIGVSGMFKIPGIFPGTEFQLSASIAVGICGVFGFKKYITAGIIASVISLLLGVQTLISVCIAMTFRLTVGVVWMALGSSRVFYALSGPLGTTAARAVITLILGKGFTAMWLAACPGMVFTALTSFLAAHLLRRCQRAVQRR
ncbi:hypothetical protein [Megasphaera lornae]|uniref:BioX family protein n=1 Tax=Megasphaera lornae TaxID=1000568 RepID=A0ABN0D204_9FIRM|nr:hypothetical protein [Megasphaera lornae]EGL42359.1 BioX family protein [Megasphaera lornae]